MSTRVAETDRGQQALDNIKAAMESMTPAQLRDFGLIAEGIAIGAAQTNKPA